METQRKDVREELLSQAERALAEWRTAENYLNYAADPDLVDCAIFDMESARRKYSFLLKKLRSE